MRFFDVLLRVTWLLLTEHIVSYRRIESEFDLDGSALEDIRRELIQIKRWAVDRDGEHLVWVGTAERLSSPSSAADVAPIEPLVPVRDTEPAAQFQNCAPAASQAETIPPTAETSTTSAPSSDAERRPLTVMFCDMADSTALSTKLDPEDLQDVIRAYQETCTGVIREYGGFVARYMGDGILVYFGYPKSLERNAERAVLSALSMLEAMTELNRTLGHGQDVEIAVRIGIATGMVVVGEVVGEGLAQERTVVGEAPNLAARLQSIAGRNGIVIGSLTKELAGEEFTYKDLGARELKGISGSVRSWGVIGRRDDGTDEADHDERDGSAAVPQLVGRDEEIGLLRRAWQSTKDEGRGQVVTISGEAGIGKSVLIDGVRAEVRAEGLPCAVLRCSPYHTNSALHPMIQHLKRVVGWQPEHTAEERLAKLEAMLATYDQPIGETVPLLASLMSLPLPEDRYPPVALTPQQQKQQTQDTIIAMILEAAERQPLLQLWEDLHWADPSTLELLGLLIEQAPTASLLMVLTARPDFVSPWPARSHITPITLNRLERPHAEALIARIAGMKPLPPEVVDHVVTKTDGVPLYVEELTKTILDSDVLRDTGERFELTGPLASLAIPDTLQESLMARLDRLPQVRELAQLASVLGREFAYEMISGLATSGERLLQEGLGQLVEANVLYQRGRPPRARYIFKHALIQDAAYQSLLKRTRETYQRRVAELLEQRFPEILATQPELVAHHYTEGGQYDRALVYWQRAGALAIQRSSYVEGIAHYRKALDLMPALPGSKARVGLELELQSSLGSALMAIEGYGAPEVVEAYARARDLCQQLGDKTEQFPVLWGLWLFYTAKGDHPTSQDLGLQLSALAQEVDDTAFLLEADVAMGVTTYLMGEFERSLEHLERGISLYDPTMHRELAYRYGNLDPGPVCLAYAACSLTLLGRAEEAERRSRESLQVAEDGSHSYTLARAMNWNSQVHQFRRDRKAVQSLAGRAFELATEKGFPLVLAQAPIMLGWAAAIEGDCEDGIEKMKEGISAWQSTGAGWSVSYFHGLLAEAYGAADDPQQGLETVRKAALLAETMGEHFYEAELSRIEGSLHLQCGETGEARAESCYLAALEIARRQKAKLLELRAATSLGRLWQQNGRLDEARELITPIYSWFTEGLDTVDLKEARSLLDELEAPASGAVGGV